MNITMKECNSKSKGVPDESRSAVKPAFFEMKQYEPNGIFQQLCFMLIRPPRFIYNPQILRPSRRVSQKFTVQSFEVPFELTLYKQQDMRYVLLYLHGNGSSRFEGTLFLPSLPDGVGLACFDFNGCGNRTEAEYITLGQSESKDVDIAAAFLKSRGYEVVGWGRSMGAVSLLMSSQLDIMIADSAYSNLSALCKESSSKFLPKACCCLFHSFFPCVFACIQCKVNNLAGLSIGEMNVTKRLKKMEQFKQICFIHGQQDTLIPPHHAKKLYESFSGKKQILLFEGTHNSTRPVDIIQKCFLFIDEALENNTSKISKNVTNAKMVEMSTIQKPELKKNTSLTQETKSSEPVGPRKYQSGLRSDANSQLNKLTSNDSTFVKLEKTPANFCSVMGSDDLEKLDENEGGAKKAKLELFFSKK